MLDRRESETLLVRAIAATPAGEAHAWIESTEQRWVRFGANEIRANGSALVRTLRIRAVYGRRHGEASTSDLSDAGIRGATERAMRAAKLSPEDPEFVPALDPQSYDDVPAYDEPTAALADEKRAAVALSCIDGCLARGLLGSGYVETSARSFALANSRGLAAHHRSTDARYTVTVRTADGTGSGWGMTCGVRFADLDAAGAAQKAMERGERSARPQAIEPGAYTVVLEADAWADLLQNVANSLGEREAAEGRSFAAATGGRSRVGERLFAENVSFRTDPLDARMRARPFSDEGFPVRRTDWVSKGVLRDLHRTRFWATKQGTQANSPSVGIVCDGGDETLDSLVRGVDRGLLVSRIHYIRWVDAKTVLLTGLTRDGLFLIEKGEIVRPVKNLRFNQSVVELLGSIEAMGRPTRTVTYEFERPIVVPPVRARGFRFVGVSDAV
jgi:predicted Zn-dependent protease